MPKSLSDIVKLVSLVIKNRWCGTSNIWDDTEKSNEIALSKIKKHISEGKEIIPFVGAGLATDFKYPTHEQLLRKICKSISRDGAKSNEVNNLIRERKYGEAISLLCEKYSKEKIFELYQKEFSKDNCTLYDAEIINSRINSLPDLVSKFVVTTNFDECLEGVFEKSIKQFWRVCCASKLEELDKSLTQKPVLIKLHGTIKDGSVKEWIISDDDIDEAYFLKNGEKHKVDPSKKRPAMLRDLASSGIFLFVGCSLEDRIIEVLQQLHKHLPIGEHYAIVELPEEATENKIKERTERLNNAGINPIWFEHGNYDAISEYLDKIKQAIIPPNPHEFSIGVANNVLLAIPGGEIVRISSTPSQYQTYSKQILTSKRIAMVIWSMNGSPLNISPQATPRLTDQDSDFKDINAGCKYRIIIFEDETEIKNYMEAMEANADKKNQERIEHFEASTKKNRGQLLYGSKKSLGGHIKQYCDFGYMLSEDLSYNLVSCSTFINSDFEKSGILKEIVRFSKFSGREEPNGWNIISELNSIQELIANIENCVQEPEEQNRFRCLENSGLYLNIKDLYDYHQNGC